MFALLALVCLLVKLVLDMIAGATVDTVMLDLGLIGIAAHLAVGPVISIPWRTHV